MNSGFEELRGALRRRLDVVADRGWYQRDPAAHLEALKGASLALDQLVAKLPGDIDPRLRHYLERQSYGKALDWLNEPAAHHG